MKSKYVIVGAGGHAKSVADAILSTGDIVSFFEDSKIAGQSIFGIPVVSSLEEIQQLDSYFLAISIGNNFIRQKVMQDYALKYPNLILKPVVHAKAYVSPLSVVGIGSVALAQSNIGPNTTIGKGCVVNSCASIDHDSQMDDFSSLGPGATLGGSTFVGYRSAVCIGASVKHGISIGSDCVLGAMSYLDKDMANLITAYGVPAKTVRYRTPDENYL